MAHRLPDISHLTFKAAFDEDTELSQYQPNALGIFALWLHLRLEDVHEFAANAITEGGDDKKIDICYLDMVNNRAIIAQTYMARDWGKKEADASKADDLNTAIAWLFSASEDQIPSRLKARAIDLREAIKNGDINKIEILYIHNCFESKNVERSLKTVGEAARNLAKAVIGNDEIQLTVVSQEFGLNKIEELYKSRDKQILIDDWLTVPIENYIPESGNGWKAILTSVSGTWIQDLHKKHGEQLFSANYRDYLGLVKRKGNINHEISTTAVSEPENFWVYNNGVTAITNQLELDSPVRIRGISIINGAQTTGALSEVEQLPTQEIKVLLRIVECTDPNLIDKVIQYNNTQNEIKAADRLSNHPIQIRLAEDLSKFNIQYVHRRGKTKTSRNAITFTTIAPALCAFHGDPQTAYRNATEIFINDSTYEKVFRQDISAEHIYLIRTLSMAIDRIKNDLKSKVTEQSATSLEEQQNEMLRYSASKFFLFYTIGVSAEEILGKRVSDLYNWKCIPNVITPEGTSMIEAWSEALRAVLPHIATLLDKRGSFAFYDVPRSADLSKEVALDLRARIAGGSILDAQLYQLRKRTTV